MKTIYRYPINPEGAPVKMPAGAEIVHAGWVEARKIFCVWALVDPTSELVKERIFIVRATGGPVTDGLHHLHTVVMPDGFHVFHIFEITD